MEAAAFLGEEAAAYRAVPYRVAPYLVASLEGAFQASASSAYPVRMDKLALAASGSLARRRNDLGREDSSRAFADTSLRHPD